VAVERLIEHFDDLEDVRIIFTLEDYMNPPLREALYQRAALSVLSYGERIPLEMLVSFLKSASDRCLPTIQTKAGNLILSGMNSEFFDTELLEYFPRPLKKSYVRTILGFDTRISEKIIPLEC